MDLINLQRVQQNYFSFLQLLSAFIWLIIILTITILIRKTKHDQDHFRFFTLNVLVKLIFAATFSLVYILYYKGGDTLAYFEGSKALNNLFFKSPELYFKHIFGSSDMDGFITDFDAKTGYPPRWIYREAEAFTVCKLISIFGFITMNSYFAMTFIMAFILAIASWKLFELLRSYKFTSDTLLAIGILFLPSVNFWCSGISKDSLVLLATFMIVYHSFKIISPQFNESPINVLVPILFSLLIFEIRPFILASILISLGLAVNTRISNKIGRLDYKIILSRIVVYSIGIIFILQLFSSSTEASFFNSNRFLKEAAIIQQDFTNNAAYGTNKYSIGEIEFTPSGLLRAMPSAIISGIYRPFIWESSSLSLIFNGLESSLFLFFSFQFFRSNFLKRINTIRKNELLIFAFGFVIIISFITGLTSGLFGVLVRLRAILLPFFFVLLSVGSTALMQSYIENIHLGEDKN